ncbi:MAG TPA: thiamine phosphate synthase [Candidatus Baltobacteraceae bacterium]|jgi:thiamine-phosphate pyrophosphorylase|nr:thiamine phosphate synthase [Candidatus Baltobacteraceae bacterium]
METHAHVSTRTQRVALLSGIYAIVNESPRCVEIARAALSADIGILQYRAKSGIASETLRTLRAMTRKSGALLIVNDDLEAVRAFECDGVHLGPDDSGFYDVAGVRAAIPDRVIGLSCGTVEEASPQRTEGADYLGVGSVYATPSKDDAGAPIGIEGLTKIATVTALPVAAIGGITVENVVNVRRSGVAMAAVISAISAAADPGEAAGTLVQRWIEP